MDLLKKIFLNNYRRNYIRYFSEGNIDGMKWIIFFCTPFLSVHPSVIIFFLLPTAKKLPTKDSQTKHFRR